MNLNNEITEIQLMSSALTSRLQQELQWFLLAIQFYTRLPVKLVRPFRDTDLNRASRYCSLVGMLVGTISAICFWGCWHLYGQFVAAVMSIGLSILVTGAFHEDGLADMADGFGGGTNPETVLNIMKDSRVGVYGALALVLSILLRVSILSQLPLWYAVVALLVTHSLSRAVAISLIWDLPYLQLDQKSKVKPVAKSISPEDLGVALAIGLLSVLLLPWETMLTLVVMLFILRHFFKAYLLNRIGGYTGDCLGALEQLAEILTLLVLGALWNLY